jgi:hypothetical protein
MAHERDDNKYDGQEDGEYHFSDDQGSYDLEPEIAPVAPKAPTASAAPAAAIDLRAKFNQYRKPIIGVGIFILLIFLIYKISAPTASVPSTDFAQNSGTIPSQKPVMKQMPKVIKVAQQTPADFQPLPQAPSMSGGSPAGAPAPTTIPTPTSSEMANAGANGMPESAAPPPPAPETASNVAPTIPTSFPTANTTTVAESYYNPAQPQPASGDKLTALTQENAKLTAEYTQKLAEAEAQNTALQNKVQDLTQRLTSMESTLANLGHVIENLKPGRGSERAERGERGNPGQMAAGIEQPTPPPVTAAPISAAGEPKSTYNVQAIIPGRAWLKSDNGETVTVAEGDILKNYGRVMKIDPYDGIVQIDTGTHIMNLAYGVSTD